MRKILLIAVAGLIAAGCTAAPEVQVPAGATQVNMLSALKFDPVTIEVAKDQPVVLAIHNKDGSLHDWAIDQIPVASKKESSAGGSGERADGLYVSARGGQTAVVQFTPTQPGTYEYYCTIPGHKASGMHGKLIVK